MSLSLDTLPSDVVSEIIGHVRVDDPLYSPFATARAAGTCALVCRALAKPAQLEAFKMICLDDRRRVVALLALFWARPALVAGVREVSLGWPGDDELETRRWCGDLEDSLDSDGPGYVDPDTPEARRASVLELAELASHMRNVRGLVVYCELPAVWAIQFISIHAHELRRLVCQQFASRHDAEAIRAATAGAIFHHARHLTHLEIVWGPDVISPYISALPQLRSIDLAVTADEGPDVDDVGPVGLGVGAVGRGLVELAPRLTHVRVSARHEELALSIGAIAPSLAARVTKLFIKAGTLHDPAAAETLAQFTQLRYLSLNDNRSHLDDEPIAPLTAEQLSALAAGLHALKMHGRVIDHADALLTLLARPSPWLPQLHKLHLDTWRTRNRIDAERAHELHRLAALRSIACHIAESLSDAPSPCVAGSPVAD